MALQVWLPLNGNLNNLGLNNITVTNSGTTVNNNGKIGKCYYFNGSSYVSENSNDWSNLTNSFSICCWYKRTTATSGNSQIIAIGTNSGWNNIRIGLLIANSSGIPIFSVSDGTNYAAHNCDGSISLPTDAWTHIVCTYNNGEMKLYLNGVLNKSYTTNIVPALNSSLHLGIGAASNGLEKITGYLNDVRIYDHCLSPKEVKEISKGLILHYPLNDVYNTSLVNKYSGDAFLGSGSGSYTKTKLANEIGYKYTYNYTGTGSDTWPNLYFANFAFTAGKTYQYSLYARFNSGNFNMTFRAARINNDWHGCSTTQFITDGQWHRYELSLYIDSSHTYSGTSYTNNPRIELYPPNLKTSGTVYTIDFDIKFVQVVESDIKVPVIDNSLVTSTVHDTSGYNNNGTITGSLGLNNDNPKYNYGTIFKNGTDYIKSNFSLSMLLLSCSFWIKPNSSNGGYNIVASNYSSPSSGFWISINCESNGCWFYNGKYCGSTPILTNGTWYHCCFTFNNGTGKWYVNGVQQAYGKNTNTATTLTITNLSIGNSYTGSNWNTKQYGNISDFRLYATALSADDVKELYDTAAYITDNGSMFTYEFDESDNEVIINNKGISKSSLLLEETAYDPTLISISGNGATHTPANNTTNSCSNGYTVVLNDVSVERKYTVELDFSWSGTWAKSSGGTLDIWILGSTKPVNSTSYAWSGGNPITTALNNYKRPQTLINTSPSGGTFHYKTLFTVPANHGYNGWNVGTRTDYSNGNGTLSYTNLKIYPYEANLDTEKTKFGNNYITAKNFIEI